MTENQKQFYGGLALIEFGSERTEPMSRGESLFWGVAMIISGAILVATS